MRHVAAYLLAAMGTGQANPASIKSILGSVGVEADEQQLNVLIEKMANKDVNQLIVKGSMLISAMPSGGGGGGAVAAGGAPAAAGAPAAEEKKEEKKEEPEEESDDDMGFGLFD